ncbi:MAG: hypothetical protein KDJ15_03915, partial [Alphaproteobacteria bacterium]|nr:hypothetical protein [Alphaproteobacteria bacterium]
MTTRPPLRLMACFTAVLLTVFFLGKTAHAMDSGYDRVMRTGTIRCGYIAFPPYLMQDLNTGEFSGLAYDL